MGVGSKDESKRLLSLFLYNIYTNTVQDGNSQLRCTNNRELTAK